MIVTMLIFMLNIVKRVKIYMNNPGMVEIFRALGYMLFHSYYFDWMAYNNLKRYHKAVIEG